MDFKCPEISSTTAIPPRDRHTEAAKSFRFSLSGKGGNPYRLSVAYFHPLDQGIASVAVVAATDSGCAEAQLSIERQGRRVVGGHFEGCLAGALAACLTEQGLKDLPSQALTPQPCLLYTSPSPRDQRGSRMPSSA